MRLPSEIKCRWLFSITFGVNLAHLSLLISHHRRVHVFICDLGVFHRLLQRRVRKQVLEDFHPNATAERIGSKKVAACMKSVLLGQACLFAQAFEASVTFQVLPSDFLAQLLAGDIFQTLQKVEDEIKGLFARICAANVGERRQDEMFCLSLSPAVSY